MLFSVLPIFFIAVDGISSLLYVFIFLPVVVEKYLWMSLLYEIDCENIIILEKP